MVWFEIGLVKLKDPLEELRSMVLKESGYEDNLAIQAHG